jgi:hypothetical protein
MITMTDDYDDFDDNFDDELMISMIILMKTTKNF